jgi:ribosomal protein S18 acetylase RimI-like enzyme
MFADARLARRIERAEMQLTTDLACALERRYPDDGIFVRPLAGGVAAFGGVGSPVSKVIGVGFEGPMDEAALDEVEREYRARGERARMEVATLADASVGALLTRRGYELIGFENVLGLRLPRPASDSPARAASAAEIAELSQAEAGRWLDIAVEGFAHMDPPSGGGPPDVFPRETLERIFSDFAAAEGFRQYVARLDDQLVAAASMRLFEGVAQLCGAATLPLFRRRGVQSAMLAERLAIAAREGCDIAVVTTAPGSKSQENVQRQGFALLYTRAVLVQRA